MNDAEIKKLYDQGIAMRGTLDYPPEFCALIWKNTFLKKGSRERIFFVDEMGIPDKFRYLPRKVMINKKVSRYGRFYLLNEEGEVYWRSDVIGFPIKYIYGGFGAKTNFKWFQVDHIMWRLLICLKEQYDAYIEHLDLIKDLEEEK